MYDPLEHPRHKFPMHFLNQASRNDLRITKKINLQDSESQMKHPWNVRQRRSTRYMSEDHAGYILLYPSQTSLHVELCRIWNYNALTQRNSQHKVWHE